MGIFMLEVRILLVTLLSVRLTRYTGAQLNVSVKPVMFHVHSIWSLTVVPSRHLSTFFSLLCGVLGSYACVGIVFLL
jgi:hypothetical protein